MSSDREALWAEGADRIHDRDWWTRPLQPEPGTVGKAGVWPKIRLEP